jgi:hypothetical protein
MREENEKEKKMKEARLKVKKEGNLYLKNVL